MVYSICNGHPAPAYTSRDDDVISICAQYIHISGNFLSCPRHA